MNYVKAGTVDYIFTIIFNQSSSFCVSMFVMISGVVFLSKSEKELSIRKIWTKNIKKLLIIYVIWSSIYAVQPTINNYIKYGIVFNLKSFMKLVIKGEFHLWFLWMIMAVYAIAPILKVISANRKILQYFLLLSLICTFIIPGFLEFKEFSIFQDVWNNCHWYFTLGFSCWFLYGYYLHSVELNIKHEIVIYVLGLFAMIISIIFRVRNVEFFMSFLKLLYTTALFVVTKYRITPLWKKTKLLTFFVDLSLGVYLIHALCIDILSKIGITPIFIYCPFGILIKAVLVLMMSCLSIFLIKRIPLIKDRLC